MTEQERDNWESLEYRIEAEGFDYCFDGYSSWKEIEDDEFHYLREKYLEAMENLHSYVTTKVRESRGDKEED